MSKIIKASKIVIMLLLSVGLICCAYERKKKVIFNSSSPDNNYTVNIWKAEKWSLIEPDVKYVSLTTVKGNEELTLKDPLYYEKDYDGDAFKDFEVAFPDSYWLTNRTFWMGKKTHLETATNKIKIINSSKKKIRQVIVETTGFFSIYDLEVNELIEIPNSLESVKIQTVAIGVAVYYSDGTSIPGKGYGLNSRLTVEKDVGDFDIVIKEATAFIRRH
jgi:hypothetical protein